MTGFTDEHTHEDELLNLRGAVNSVGSAIYTIDRSYRITMVNAAWNSFATSNGGETLIGPQIIGTNLLDGMRGQPREETQRTCEAIFRGELERYERDYDCSSPTERRIYTLVISPLRNDNGDIVGAAFINHNITRRKMLEEDLKTRNRDVRGMVEELRQRNELLATERDRAQALGHVLNTINASLSVPAAIEAVLDVAIALVHVDAAAIFLLSPDGQSFTPSGSRKVDMVESEPEVFQASSSLAGEVIKGGQALFVANTATRPDLRFPTLTGSGQPVAILSVPINTYRGPIGVLEVYASQIKHFDEQEHTVLTTLAASAGVAISNARLFDEQVRARAQAERMAQVAAEQTAQLLATFSSLSDGVWICDKQGIIISINDAALHMFTLKRETVIGTQLSDLQRFYEVVRGERRRLGLRVALQGEHMHTECEIVVPHRTQHLIVDIRAAPVHDEHSNVIGAVSVVRDITQAHAMARLKDDFLAIAAHELKTPITALKGYTQLVLKRTRNMPGLENIRRTLNIVDEQADRISGLVHKLLDVTRIQTGKLELLRTSLDLHALVAKMVARAQDSAPSQCFELEPHAPIIVDVDPHRIEQVLKSLLDNAEKYSAGMGTIAVTTSTDDRYAFVKVNDRGVGIPAEKLPHIFDQWYQAHFTTQGDYGGMGLGLYISKEIVEQHGGYMWAESSAHGGTTVGFALPLLSSAESNA